MSSSAFVAVALSAVSTTTLMMILLPVECRALLAGLRWVKFSFNADGLRVDSTDAVFVLFVHLYCELFLRLHVVTVCSFGRFFLCC